MRGFIWERTRGATGKEWGGETGQEESQHKDCDQGRSCGQQDRLCLGPPEEGTEGLLAVSMQRDKGHHQGRPIVIPPRNMPVCEVLITAHSVVNSTGREIHVLWELLPCCYSVTSCTLGEPGRLASHAWESAPDLESSTSREACGLSPSSAS